MAVTNAINALNPENWKPIVQDYLNNMLVSTKIANTRCEAYLSDGDQVNFPRTSDVRVQNRTAGTPAAIDPIEATQDSLIIDQDKLVTFQIDPAQEKQARAEYGMELAYQAAYHLRNNIDQAVFQQTADDAQIQLNPTTVDVNSFYGQLTTTRARLSRNNATDAPLFAVIDPEREALLSQIYVEDGFVQADMNLNNSFRGSTNGFNIYVSNNLPTQVPLTIDTNPTDGDSLEIFGLTYTFVDTIGTAPGNVLIGADLATTRSNLINVVAADTSEGASTANYIVHGVDDRRDISNVQATIGTFAANVSIITGYGRVEAAASFTTVTNVIGTEQTDLLFGRMGAPSLAIQMMPELYIREEQENIGRNYLTHTLYGTATFDRDQRRIARMRVTA